MDGEKCIGTIVCKLAPHKSGSFRGYLAMLAVDSAYRKQRLGEYVVHHVVVFLFVPCVLFTFARRAWYRMRVPQLAIVRPRSN